MNQYRAGPTDPPTVPIPRLIPGQIPRLDARREPPQFIRRGPVHSPGPPPTTPPPMPPPPFRQRRPSPPPSPPQRRRPPPPPSGFTPPPPSGLTPPRPKPAPRRRRSLGRRLVLVVLVMGLLIPAATLAAGVWLDANLRRVAVLGEDPGRPTSGSGTNWLLVGSDGRADLSPEQQAELSTGGDLGSSRTDTILVVHVPGVLSAVPPTVVSIPRDSYLEIPGWGMDKVNAAFAQGGPALLIQTVEQATGLRIDHYVEVGFGGFGAIVDGLGGVRICLAEPLADPLAGVDLPAGCQTVPGNDALGYVRSRDTPRADLDRMRHQREFMAALLERVSAPAVWLNPWRWYAVAHAVAAALTVDQSAHVWELARLAWALHGPVTTVTVPIGEATGSEVGAVLVWDADAAAGLFGALRTDTAIPQQVFDAQP